MFKLSRYPCSRKTPTNKKPIRTQAKTLNAFKLLKNSNSLSHNLKKKSIVILESGNTTRVTNIFCHYSQRYTLSHSKQLY